MGYGLHANFAIKIAQRLGAACTQRSPWDEALAASRPFYAQARLIFFFDAAQSRR